MSEDCWFSQGLATPEPFQRTESAGEGRSIVNIFWGGGSGSFREGIACLQKQFAPGSSWAHCAKALQTTTHTQKNEKMGEALHQPDIVFAKHLVHNKVNLFGGVLKLIFPRCVANGVGDVVDAQEEPRSSPLHSRPSTQENTVSLSSWICRECFSYRNTAGRNTYGE